MVDQMQVSTVPSSPIDAVEYERVIAALAAGGVVAQREGNTLVIVSPYVTIPLPQFHLIVTEAYAAGYTCGQQQCRQSIKADVSVSLTDHDFTKQIDQAIPATLSPEAHRKWREGFITGWVMQWYQEWSN